MTKDKNGNRCFVLTLQAREQHIRREKATSNICTNQALMALQGCIHTAWLGEEGFAKLAHDNTQRAHYAAEKACEIDGVELYFNQPFFNEFCLKINGKPVERIVEILIKDRIFAGIPCSQFDTSLTGGLLVSVTEKRSKDDIDKWVLCLKKAIQN
jgi:glycine dehydrogenase subunit 1